jgi:hypothetical protein
MKSAYIRKGMSARSGLCLLGAVLVGNVYAQSFNIDLDVFFGPPEVGHGAPSDAFPGAAGQPGRWNQRSAVQGGPSFLLGLDGVTTSVVLTVTGSAGSGGGSPFPGNTGDFALLLNDYAVTSGGPLGGNVYTFTGLIPGLYIVTTYAVWPVEARDTIVTVVGAQPPNPQVVTGPMPGNQFILGVTHAVHLVEVSDGTLTIRPNGPAQGISGYVNGFQLTVVPEPGTILGILAGAATLLLARRKRA